MKLYTSGPSPFVRKVMVAAHELGLASQITTVPSVLSPVAPDTAVSRKNPLGKIPTLELSDGTVIYDSRVICEYFDTLHGERKLVPESGAARFACLRVQALADGLLDAGILVRYETFLRPEPFRWSEWVKGQCDKVLAAIDALEGERDSFGRDIDLGQIAAVCAIGWLDFRKPLESDPRGGADLRARAPRLYEWYEHTRKRPSFAATEPSA
jgi:glutathione S-transferase